LFSANHTLTSLGKLTVWAQEIGLKSTQIVKLKNTLKEAPEDFIPAEDNQYTGFHARIKAGMYTETMDPKEALFKHDLANFKKYLQDKIEEKKNKAETVEQEDNAKDTTEDPNKNAQPVSAAEFAKSIFPEAYIYHEKQAKKDLDSNETRFDSSTLPAAPLFELGNIDEEGWTLDNTQDNQLDTKNVVLADNTVDEKNKDEASKDELSEPEKKNQSDEVDNFFH
jgi:hypothetical protein